MNTATFRKLSSACGRRADKHFDCMTKWAVHASNDGGHLDGDLAKKCKVSAINFKEALEREIAYLERRSQNDDVEARLARSRYFLDLVIRDLTFLANR